MGLNYIISNIISYFAGVINSFYWNKKYVFDNDSSDLRSLFSSFSKLLASSAFTGLIINNMLLYFWVSVLGISSIFGPLLNLLVTYPLNYILSKYWAFK
jgi:putative flippase GtrA